MDNMDPSLQQSPPATNPHSLIKTKNLLILILILLLFLFIGVASFYIYKYQQLVKQQSIPVVEEKEAEIEPTTTQMTPEPWLTYINTIQNTSAHFKKFILHYPHSWNLKESSREFLNQNSLTLTISKTNGDYFEIIQSAGGGGWCLFPDDSKYDTFEGNGTKFVNYSEIKKNSNITWRLADSSYSDTWTHYLCERNNKEQIDFLDLAYKDSTTIGFTKIKLTTPESVNELKEILNKIEILD